MAYEEPVYTVIEKNRNIEIRQYEPYIVAETLVEAEFDDAGNEGFRRLFRYISGQNRSTGPVAMSAPVTQEKAGEKIPMTAPVNMDRAENTWRITFMMPSSYSMETLPEPLDERVVLKRVPGRLVAALRYSGTWSRKRYEKKRTELQDHILKTGFKPGGGDIFARYDAPYKLWFFRRNEVLIPVEKTSGD